MKKLILAAAAIAALPLGTAAHAQYYNGYNNTYSNDGYYDDRQQAYNNQYQDYQARRDQYEQQRQAYEEQRNRYADQRNQYEQNYRNWLFNEGDRVPYGYRGYVTYYGIPQAYRYRIPRYYRGGNWRYIYRGDAIYVVDPTTALVRDIIDLTRY